MFLGEGHAQETGFVIPFPKRRGLGRESNADLRFLASKFRQWDVHRALLACEAPDGQERGLARDDAEARPRGAEAREAERPNRLTAPDEFADGFVISDPLLHQRQAAGGDLMDASALVDAQEQGVDHVEDGLLLACLLERVAPDGGLLGGDRRGRGCGYDAGEAVIGLVAGGLDAVMAERGVIHPHAAAGAVLDHEAGMALHHRIHPGKEGAVVLQQTIAESIGF